MMSVILKHLVKNPVKESFQIQVRHRRSSPYIPLLPSRFKVLPYYSFEERLREVDEKLKDPELFAKINIGFSLHGNSSKNTIERRKILRNLKLNPSLEKKARQCTLKLDLDVVESDWISETKPVYMKSLAENYDIFKHLFGDYAYFYPVVHMDIFYDFDGDTVSPVFAGNLLKPKETTTAPTVEFESEPSSLWTLVVTNPDGNYFDNESEMLHWFVGNIPGGKVTEGDEIVDYIRPIPPRGTGFHRLCFVLYKQNERLDFSQYRRKKPCLTLKERTFKTYDFYKHFEDVLTPAGLSWFQADYDSSLTDFFHKTLRMKEPRYEYEFPKPYIKPQVYFPHLQPFNRYLDLHRDPKEMQKLMLLKRLARVHPFQGEKPLLPFPQAVPLPRDLPIWQKNEMQNERDGRGKYRDMYRGDDRPYIHTEKINRFPFSNLSES